MSSNQQRARGAALIFAAVLVAGSCENSDVLAPTGSTIALTTNPTKVVFAAGDVTSVPVAVTARVVGSGGFPETGVAVTFATTGGTLASGGRSVETDANSVAKDTLTVPSDAPSSIDITATSGAITQKITLTKTVGGLAPSDGSIVLSANPSNFVLDANQGEFSKDVALAAQVFDKSGAPIQGIAVRFIQGSGVLADNLPVLSDQVGIAANTLTLASTDPDATTVQAVSAAIFATVNITKTEIALVVNKPPIAIIAALPQREAQVGQQVIFDGSSSSDPDTNGTIVLYHWTINSDSACCQTGLPGGCTCATKDYPPSDATLSLGNNDQIYSEPQNLSVRLEVTDNLGAKDVRTIAYSIVCTNPAPTANAGPDQNVPGTSGNPVSVVLDGSTTTDDKPIGVTSDHYDWNCGNGTVATALVPGDFRKMICRYTATPALFTFTATLSVSDNGATGDLVNGVYPCQKTATDTATVKIVLPAL